MQNLRRTLLALLGSVALGAASGIVSEAQAQSNMNDAVSVRVVIQDEAGKPIPYVTVWRFVLIAFEQTRHANLQLDALDLWRITQRYGRDHEVISFFGDKPVLGLEVVGMGDRSGYVDDAMNYTERTGRGNNYQRPDPLVFGYTFMKRGYFPGKLDFSVPRTQDTVQATLTLKRNPTEAIETAPYIQTFERVRYELSQRQDTSHTPENQRRVRAFGEQLEAAAQQAIAAGDKAAAARIYLRSRHLPDVLLQNTADLEVRGFSHRGNVAAAQRALDMAYELDPENAYVQMQTYSRSLVYPENATTEQRIRIHLTTLEKLISRYGERIWPVYYLRRALAYAELGDYVKAHGLYDQAAKFEPRYTDWDKRIDDMKREMRRKKVPIPEGW